jgi:hypothetical protein
MPETTARVAFWLRPVLATAVSNARWAQQTRSAWTQARTARVPTRATSRSATGALSCPETSCKEFNRFLDRGLVIGTFTDPHLGFFSDLDM